MTSLSDQESEVKSQIDRLSRLAIQHMAECDRAALRAGDLFNANHYAPTEEVDWLIDKSYWHFREAVRLFAIGETLHQEWRRR